MGSASLGREKSPLYRAFCSFIVILSISTAVAGCGTIPLFDEKTQDKAACDKFSEVWTGQGADTSQDNQSLLTLIYSQGSFDLLADKTESEVLPLASMNFSTDIKELIKYLRKSSSQSIFDRMASWTYGLDTLGQVTGHCILVSKD